MASRAISAQRSKISQISGSCFSFFANPLNEQFELGLFFRLKQRESEADRSDL
jgi:hypothetical protein